MVEEVRPVWQRYADQWGMRDLLDQMTCWRTHRVRPWLGDVIGGVPAAILLRPWW
jgi:hypothetical protein